MLIRMPNRCVATGLILHLLCMLTGHQMYVQARVCIVSQEANTENGGSLFRWVLPKSDACGCTSVQLGNTNPGCWQGTGNVPAEQYQYNWRYINSPLLSKNLTKIRRYYGLQCKVVCPANQTNNTNPGQSTAVVDWNPPSVKADAGEESIGECNPSSGSNFAIGETEIVCQGMVLPDTTGAPDKCHFYVNIVDKESPNITCPQDIHVIAPNGEKSAKVSWVSPNATDNSGLSPISIRCFGPGTGGNGKTWQIGSRTIKCEANDTSGNIGTCKFRVTVIDNQPPVIHCPSQPMISSGTGNNSKIVSWNMENMADDNDVLNKTDNHRIVTVQCTPSSGSTFQVGRTVVNCTAYDYSMNSASCIFSVGIEDIECYTMLDGSDYRGYHSTTTEGGLTCQEWSTHTPHTSYFTPATHPNSGLGGHNHCRNPSHSQRPWCYTMDPEKRWNYCDVGSPCTICL